MNKKKDDNLKASESYDYKDVPVFHWDLPLEDYDDTVSAAEWAWSCLEELAKAYCQFFCDRGKCSEEAIFFNKEKMETWQEKQKSFHDALSYLPQTLNKIDGCHSCAVVKAFANFPILIKLSKIFPVAIFKSFLRNILGMTLVLEIEGKDEFDKIENYSMPCCKIEEEIIVRGENVVIGEEKRIREVALLDINLNNLPLMPPLELSKIKKPLLEGQNILKYLYKLSHPYDSIKYDSEPENTNETTDNNGEGINDEKEKPVATELQEIPPAKKLRPNQETKIKCQELAKIIWRQNPDMTIKEMSEHEDILECGGKYYRPRTRYNWVKEISPSDKHRHGRPRKK